jgi:hypothetical protein
VLAIGPFVPPPPPKITDIVWESPVQKKGYDKAYTESASRSYNGFASSDHVVKFPDGSINFFGYGDVGRVDYIWSTNDEYRMIDTFTFTLSPKSMNFHTFSQTAFMFNGTKNGSDYTGYAVVLADDGTLGLYKGTFSLVANSDAYGTGGYAFPSDKRVATYATGISNGSAGSYTIKLAVDPRSSKRSFKIYVNGSLKTTADSAYGSAHGLGFSTGYHSHSCAALTVISYSKIDITMDPSVLEESNYPSSNVTVKFLQNGTAAALADPQTYTATALYRSWSVANIPQAIEGDGKTYKLIRSDPPTLTAQDADGAWAYSEPFPDVGADKTLTLWYDDVAVSKAARLNGGLEALGSPSAPVETRPSDVISYAITVKAGAGGVSGGSPWSVYATKETFTGVWSGRSDFLVSSVGGRAVYTPKLKDYNGMNEAGMSVDQTYAQHEVEISFGVLSRGTYHIKIPIMEYKHSATPTSFGHWNTTMTLKLGSLPAAVIDQQLLPFGNNDGHTGFNHNANLKDFGTFHVPAEGAEMKLTLSGDRSWQSTNAQTYPDVSFGWVLGQPQVTRDCYVEDQLPANLSLVEGSLKVNGADDEAHAWRCYAGPDSGKIIAEVEGMAAEETRVVTFDAKVGDVSGVTFDNAGALHYGLQTFQTGHTYHRVPGPTTVTEHFMELLNGTKIQDDRPVLVPIGGDYARTDLPDITYGGVTYRYEGWKWDDDAELRPGTPGAAAEKLGFVNHDAYLVYKDSRGYATVEERYRLYDEGAGGAPVPGSKDSRSIFGAGETDYVLPLAKLGDITYAPPSGGAPDAYTYWGYSVGEGGPVHVQSDTDTKYPQEPLLTGLAPGDARTVTFYYVKNPKLSIQYMQCDNNGNPLGQLPGKTASLTQEARGEPLYFDEYWKEPLGTSGQYKYYGWQREGEEVQRAAPEGNLISDALADDCSLTLWYVDAREVSVVFLEDGNIYNMLKPAVGITVDAGGAVRASDLAGYAEDFTAGGKDYDYQGYSIDGSEEPTSASNPADITDIDSDMELRLFFSTNYTVTELWHENATATAAENGEAPPPLPADLGPAPVHVVKGGGTATATPPQLLTKYGRDWALAGYKKGNDNETLNPMGTPAPVGTGPVWADQTIIFAYNQGPQRPNFPVKMEIDTWEFNESGVMANTTPTDAPSGTSSAIGAGGRVEASGQNFAENGNWYQGLAYSLRAEAAPGWAFAGWTKKFGSYGELSAPKSPSMAKFTPASAESPLTEGDGTTWGAVLQAAFQKGYKTDAHPEKSMDIPQDGDYVAIDVVGLNGYPGQTSISDLTWFREPLNRGGAYATAAAFWSAYDAAADADKGVFPAKAWGGFEGDEKKRTAQLPADQNGRYWFHVRYEGKDADNRVVSYEDVIHLDITNIYTRFDLWQRDWDESNHVDISPYALVETAEAKPAAFPYDLHGEAAHEVITPAPPSGYRHASFAPTKPERADAWAITRPDGEPWETSGSMNVALDADFFKNLAPHADDTDEKTGGHKYTFVYERLEDAWGTTKAYFIDDLGNLPITVGNRDSDDVIINSKGGFFDAAGGRYLPPDDDGADGYVAVGWLISDVSPPAIATYTPQDDFSALSANFEYHYGWLTGDPGTDTPPSEWFYVVYHKNGGGPDKSDKFRVTEAHRLYDPAREGNGKFTGESVAPDTYKLVTDGKYHGESLKNLPGLVSVGIDKGDGSPPEIVPWKGYPDESQDGFVTFDNDAVAESFTVIYYYEASTSWNTATDGSDTPTGIPDSDLATVTARWREQPTEDGSGGPVSDGWRIKPPDVYHTRKGADFTVTNDSVYPTPVGTAGGVPGHKILTPLTGLPNLAWLFNNVGDNKPSRTFEKLAENVGGLLTDARSIFYYLRASDGTSIDHDQYVTIRYIDGGVFPYDTVKPTDNAPVHQAVYALLQNDGMTKAAPRYTGYMAVGTYAGDYGKAEEGTSYEAMAPPEDVALTIGAGTARGDKPEAIWSFIYHKGASFIAEVDGEHDRVTSKNLTLMFDAPVKDLSAANVRVKGYHGAAASVTGGQSQDDGRVWVFDLEGVTEDDPEAAPIGSRNLVSVSLTSTEEMIFSGPCDLELKKGPTLLSAEFVGGTKDREDSSALVLTFDKPVAKLFDHDVSLTELSQADVARLVSEGRLGSAADYEGPARVAFAGSTPLDDENKKWALSVTAKSADEPSSGVYAQGWANAAARPMGYVIDGQPLPARAHAEKRWLSYDANAPEGDVTGTAPADASSERWAMTVAGNPGGLARPGYDFYGWNAAQNGKGTRYAEGDPVPLLLSPGLEAEPSKTVLYAEWIAPPTARLASPRVVEGEDGVPTAVMLSGRVFKTSHDFLATLEWRQAGTDDAWAAMFTDKLVTDADHPDGPAWRFGGDGGLTISASAITEGAEYEVRLTARDVLEPGYMSQDTAKFIMNAAKGGSGGSGGSGGGSGGYGSGGTDINGWIDNQTEGYVTVVVTLCKGDTALIPPPPVILGIPDGASVSFTFHNVIDGYYNIVADNGEYRVTKGVYTKAGRAYDSLTGELLGDNGKKLVMTLGKTQSVVSINDPYAPRASVDDLPSLFDAAHPDIYGDEDKNVVRAGGTVGVRVVVSQYDSCDGRYAAVERPPTEDREAIEAQAKTDRFTVAEWLDLSLRKAIFDAAGVTKSAMTLEDAGQPLLIAFELPESCRPPAQVAAVYRFHDGAAETIGARPNAEGESFSVQSGYLLLRARRFSTYAIATTPARQGGDGGGAGTGVLPGSPAGGAEGASGAAISHMAYINGYPDGSVRPDGLLTRAEAAMIFYRLNGGASLGAAGQAGAGQGAAGRASPFPDVAANSWYGQAVAFLASKGTLTGYPNGMFLPSGQVTRAELTALIERSHADPKTAVNPFSDLPESHWARDYVLSGAAKGWLEGYPDGSFRPDAGITRAEAVKALNGWLDRRRFSPYLALRPTPYNDLSPSHWAWNDLLEASLAHEFRQGADGVEVWVE